MSEFARKIKREIDLACQLPDDKKTTVWRYMNIDKFTSLVDKKSLYLCRSDLLQDRFEGTYSRQQILEIGKWSKEIGNPTLKQSEIDRCEQERLKTYISCWCKSDCDLDLMWKGYIGNSKGVAIKSSIERLVQVCDNAVRLWPLDISMVEYFDHAGGESIDYFGTPKQFLYKDHHFKLDNEVRIIHHPNMVIPSPDHVFLPVDLKLLIEEVVLPHQSTLKDIDHIRKKLDDADLEEILIFASRYDRELIDRD